MTETRWGYRAANASGATVEGEIDAPSEQGAVDALRRRALWATAVWQKSGIASASPSATSSAPEPNSGSSDGFEAVGDGWWSRSFGGGRVPPGALAAVVRAISTLLGSGVSLEQALAYAAAQAPPGPLRAAFAAVRTDVRNGRSLADAFRTHALFPPLFPALAATGEATGSLDTSLARLAESIERSDALRARIRAALLYPALLGVAAIFGVTVILLVVVPRFAVLLQQAGGKLPFSTQLLMGVSALVTRGWPVWILLGLTAAVGWRRWLSLKGNALRFHAWRLRLPMVGGLERSMAAARYTRTLSLALPSGVDLLLAMRLARGAVSNRLIEQQLGEAEGRVRNGGSVAQSIGGTLPPLAIQLLDAGEASGALAELSARAADAFDGETERALAQAVTLIEPLLILGFGGVIGFVALGLLQAIYGINASTL